MELAKTKKGNLYVVTSFDEINKTNKEIADEGGDVFEQYGEPLCKHGENLADCFICESD